MAILVIWFRPEGFASVQYFRLHQIPERHDFPKIPRRDYFCSPISAGDLSSGLVRRPNTPGGSYFSYRDYDFTETAGIRIVILFFSCSPSILFRTFTCRTRITRSRKHEHTLRTRDVKLRGRSCRTETVRACSYYFDRPIPPDEERGPYRGTWRGLGRDPIEYYYIIIRFRSLIFNDPSSESRVRNVCGYYHNNIPVNLSISNTPVCCP